MSLILSAMDLKSTVSRIHQQARDLPEGEAAIVHRIADTVWEQAQELDLVAACESHLSRKPAA